MKRTEGFTAGCFLKETASDKLPINILPPFSPDRDSGEANFLEFISFEAFDFTSPPSAEIGSPFLDT